MLVNFYPLKNNADDNFGSNDGSVNGAEFTGDCCNFDGNDYISLGENFIGSGSGIAFSISFWYNQTTKQNNTFIFSSNLLLIGTNNATEPVYLSVFNNRDGNGANNAKHLSFTLGETGCWNHIVLTSSLNNGTIKLYKNGSFVSETSSNSGAWTATYGNSIGSQKYGSVYQYFWYGKIKEIMIWNEVLSSNQVKYLYNQQKRIIIPSYLF